MKRSLSQSMLGIGALAALIFSPISAAAFATDNAAEAQPTESAQATAPEGTGEAATEDDQNLVTLNLYNLTDVHGHISQVTDRKDKTKIKEAGLAAVGCYLNEARKANPNSAFTLLGDNVGASPYTSGVLYDNPTIAALNLLNPVASTLGNHELDLGQDAFKARIDGTSTTINGQEVQFTKVGFPYLAANVTGMGDYLKSDVIWTSPSGVKVAYIGAIAQDVPYKLSPGTTAGLEFLNPIAIADERAKELKESGQADVVILMLDDDVKNNYPLVGPHIDGLMGGDTHVPYSFSWVQGAAGTYLSADASGSYTDNLANLVITYDRIAKKVVHSEVQLIPAGTVAECGQDPAIAKIVADAEEEAKIAGEKVVATGYDQPFNRGIFGDAGPGSNRGTESTLGDLAADAMRARILGPDHQPVDIGVINAGGLREDLIPNTDGSLTYAQTYQVMPFSNELGYVSITGSQFKEALEQQWKTDLNSQNSRPMLKLGLSSNVRYTYDPALPLGERITSVMVNDEPLDMDRTYTVGSVTFLLDGGDGFTALTANGPAVTNGDLDRDAFNAYLATLDNHEPRTLKASVGVTLPEGTVPTDGEFAVALRGLSFTEGPGQAETVTLTLGNAITKADVDNSIADDNANNENAIITTDGAGQAQFTLNTRQVCGTDTGSQTYKVHVANKFGELVTADQGLTVTVECPAPLSGPIAAPTAEPTQSAAPAPGDNGKDSKSDKNKKKTSRGSQNLATTGAPADTALLLSLSILSVGGTIIAVSRKCSSV
ncbi:bifunctional metallophosphatase/5'-nucleotidase [Actinomyces vulturis]|uniref:bifunctional metallophosphatase/5'-nucleotidase n=1 Tax=Actinomyces vulturis TaxID=1857645 RepID=UPI0008304604|nr:bifunctional UDP-sugar hydrolase/5'-nucleotidase [Actinomyces vulturis]